MTSLHRAGLISGNKESLLYFEMYNKNNETKLNNSCGTPDHCLLVSYLEPLKIVGSISSSPNKISPNL